MAEISIIGGINIDIEGLPGALQPEDSNPGKISLAYGGVGRNIVENAPARRRCCDDLGHRR